MQQPLCGKTAQTGALTDQARQEAPMDSSGCSGCCTPYPAKAAATGLTAKTKKGVAGAMRGL